MIDKRCRLMKTYGWTPDYIRKKLPGSQGWVYYYWALENELTLFGSKVKRITPGYIKQEAQCLMKASSA